MDIIAIALGAFVAGAVALWVLLRARAVPDRGGRSDVPRADPAAGRLDARLEALHDDLDRVSALVRSLEQQRERQYGALAEQIAHTGARTAELHETTQALREALASSRARGQWGERLADDVLRTAGFVEGVSYRRQRAVEGGGIPDFTFLLPQGREVRMDVKFPLDNYLRHLQAETPGEADAARRAFLRDVRERLRELDGRGYLDGEGTVECLLLFVPNEQLFGFLCEQAPELLDEALGRKVVLCSPLTLFAVLAVIRQAAESFRLARTSREIIDALAAFEQQWAAFGDQLDRLGTHLERAQGAFESLVTTRRRQLERQLDRIDALRRGEPARS